LSWVWEEWSATIRRALVVDGRVVAAAEEERFLRDKHAKGKQRMRRAILSAIRGSETRRVQVVAIPFAPVSIFSPARWHFAARHWYAPDRAFTALFNGNRRFRRNVRNVLAALDRLGVDRHKIQFIPVEHHLAHASSAYHLSGYEQAAILSVDGVGEYCTTWFGHGRGGDIPPAQRVFCAGLTGRVLRRDYGISRVRDAGWRVQGDGHGALRGRPAD
jgi:carbamoyltransferase